MLMMTTTYETSSEELERSSFLSRRRSAAVMRRRAIAAESVESVVVRVSLWMPLLPVSGAWADGASWSGVETAAEERRERTDSLRVTGGSSSELTVKRGLSSAVVVAATSPVAPDDVRRRVDPWRRDDVGTVTSDCDESLAPTSDDVVIVTVVMVGVIDVETPWRHTSKPLG